MGSVERVEDTATGRTLALKRLLLDPERTKRNERLLGHFELEYHVLSHLSHPRIIKVFDYGRDVLGPYYTMEVLDGKDLKALAPLPYRQACAVARDVVSSLAILHGRGYVHRDVTPQNIRCNEDGQAKLFDFGAMCPVGVPKDVVGTPPYVSPEALQRNALDGRTDLFALGSTLYYALTGLHAYPARTLAQLPDTWRSVPRSPRSLVSDVPERLDELVMELLSLSPVARPQSAAVVFERLVAIGELPRDEQLEVRSAYLACSTLVGCEDTLAHQRVGLLKAMRGRGNSVLLSGPAGAGRSRALDTLALESKILGAVVLRADAADAAEPYGALRSLVQQLADARPQYFAQQPALKRLRAGAPISVDERQALLEAWNGWILGYARAHRLVITVDDVHLLDEPSLAGIAGLASELQGSRLLLAATRAAGEPGASTAAMELLASHAAAHALAPLSFENVHKMLRSIFGEVRGLQVLAAVLFEHAKGNPGLTMEAAQALVDAKVLRYEAGAWVLPTVAIEVAAALPHDPGLRARLAGLTRDARELAALLALDAHRQLTAADYAEVSTHGDATRSYDALDALLSARVLCRRGERVDFARTDYSTEIAHALPEQTAIEAHGRLACFYQRIGHSSAQAHHAAAAGDWDAAECLAIAADTDDLSGIWLRDPTAAATYEAVIAARAAADPRAPCLLPLRCRMFMLFIRTEEWARIAQQGPAIVNELAERCGIRDYAELDAQAPQERLSTAIARVEQRNADNLARCGLDAASGMSLLDALRQLPTLMLGVAAASVLAADPAIATDLPALQPFYPLSPAFPLVDRLRVAIAAVAGGDVAPALRDMRAIHAELWGDAHGLEPAVADSLRHFSQGFLQGMEVTLGSPAVLERLDYTRGHSAKRAERERYAYYLAVGDAEMAAKTRRDLDRLEVQSGALKYFPHCWEVEFSLHLCSRDVRGMRRCEEEARRVASELPQWQVRAELARVSAAFFGAANEETVASARQLVERCARATSNRRYAIYALTLGLIDLGRYEEARAVARAEVDSLGRPLQWHDGYELMCGLAEAHLGLHDDARRHVDSLLQLYAEAGVGGVVAGHAHENAALIALYAGDQERFAVHAAHCAAYYRSGFNPDLTTRYEVLMRRARQLQVKVSHNLAKAARFAQRESSTELLSLFRTELSTILDPESRHRHLLSLLVQRTRARGGLLYLADSAGSLHRAAELGSCGTGAELDNEVCAHWHADTQSDWIATVTADEAWGQLGTVAAHAPNVKEHELALRTLIGGHPERERACGVVVLALPDTEALHAERTAMAALARLLQEEGVSGLPLNE